MLRAPALARPAGSGNSGTTLCFFAPTPPQAGSPRGIGILALVSLSYAPTDLSLLTGRFFFFFYAVKFFGWRFIRCGCFIKPNSVTEARRLPLNQRMYVTAQLHSLAYPEDQGALAHFPEDIPPCSFPFFFQSILGLGFVSGSPRGFLLFILRST